VVCLAEIDAVKFKGRFYKLESNRNLLDAFVNGRPLQGAKDSLNRRLF